MSRLLRCTAVVVALVSLGGIVCKKNSPPDPPQIQGPIRGKPGAALTYGFTSTDPDGDSVEYMVSWGDGTPTAWSPSRHSDSLYTVNHTYSNSGTYYIQAKAKDSKDAESAWTESTEVTIGSFPPNAPFRPTGPTRCTTGTVCTYSTRAVHPLDDSVSIQFSWGDTVGDWGPMVGSNKSYTATHVFTAVGTYMIAARARDALGLLSDWSESLAVTVDTAHHTPPGAPHGLVLTAATDSTVNVAWLAPTDSGYTPSRYVVLFEETGTTHFDSIGDTVSLSFVHDPHHRTGKYEVAAVYDTTHVPSTEAPSTAPIMNTLQSVPELSVSGVNTGYGWDRTTGQAFLYDMTVRDSFDKVDFYVTDFAPGFAGPDYFVASPDTAPLDPGGSVPSAYWHITQFSHLDSTATEDSILPSFIASRYRKSSILDTLPRLVACYTQDFHYGLLNVTTVDTTNGTADIVTWFQLIPNLRLIEH